MGRDLVEFWLTPKCPGFSQDGLSPLEAPPG